MVKLVMKLTLEALPMIRYDYFTAVNSRSSDDTFVHSCFECIQRYHHIIQISKRVMILHLCCSL